MRSLPRAWEMVQLRDLGRWTGGGTPSKSHSAYWVDTGIPWVSPKDMKRALIDDAQDHISESAVAQSSTNLVPMGSILLVTRSGILSHTLPVAKVLRAVAINQDLKALIPRENVDSDYILYVLQSNQDAILNECGKAGTTVANLDTDKLLNFRIPLPPFTEQQRIVARLQALLGHSDGARKELVKIPKLVERYRQAILSAAFCGNLTAKWRKTALKSSSGAEMVRHLCEAHAENGGHKRGNAAPPTEGAHTLTRRDFPDTWGLAELRDLVQPSAPITYGILKPGPDCDGGILYVRVADFPNDLLNITRMRRTSTKIDAEFKRSHLKTGDILLSIRGTVGRICSIPQALDGANITQDSARVRLQEVLVPAYIEWMLRSPALQKAMQLAIKGVAVRGINIGDVRALQIPIPSFEEQREIVKRIIAAFDRINRLSKVETARAASLLDRLEQATLAKAFCGELS
jgi:type I restriction enzyme S subunit